jgi:hypothetical protein
VGDGFDLLDSFPDIKRGWSWRSRILKWGGDGSWGWVVVEFTSVGPVEVEVSGDAFDPPASFVDEGVMMPAEHDQIVETGRSAL